MISKSIKPRVGEKQPNFVEIYRGKEATVAQVGDSCYIYVGSELLTGIPYATREDALTAVHAYERQLANVLANKTTSWGTSR